MDPVTQKLIDSRRKSIAKLNQECKELERLAGESTNPQRRKVYQAQSNVRAIRRDNLQAELDALEADQPSLPGVGQVKPPVKR